MRLKKNSIFNYFLLQVAFFIYALSSFFSKFATYNNSEIMLIAIRYSISIIFLGIYAIIWQQVLKRMNLSLAFSNKGIVIIWGLILGTLFLNEHITLGKIVGSIIVIFGIIILMSEKKEEKK